LNREDRDDVDGAEPTQPIEPTIVPDINAVNFEARLRCPYLLDVEVVQSAAVNRPYFTGIRGIFAVPPGQHPSARVIWHELGHEAVAIASIWREAREGRGVAGEEIFDDFAAIVGLPPRALTDADSPFFRLRQEYIADAFLLANTGEVPLYPETLRDLPALDAVTLRAFFAQMHLRMTVA